MGTDQIKYDHNPDLCGNVQQAAGGRWTWELFDLFARVDSGVADSEADAKAACQAAALRHTDQA